MICLAPPEFLRLKSAQTKEVACLSERRIFVKITQNVWLFEPKAFYGSSVMYFGESNIVMTASGAIRFYLRE